MLGLKGKNAIVTGASRGIGEAVARSLVDLGVGVVGVGRTFPPAWDGQFSQPEKAVKVVGDVSDPETAESALKMCLDKFGSVEILVNNAGIVINTGILDLNMEDWDRQMDTNLKSFVYFCRAVAPQMVKQKSGGRIVNISSVAASFFESGLLAYSTTKGAIISLTRGLSIVSRAAQHHRERGRSRLGRYSDGFRLAAEGEARRSFGANPAETRSFNRRDRGLGRVPLFRFIPVHHRSDNNCRRRADNGWNDQRDPVPITEGPFEAN